MLFTLTHCITVHEKNSMGFAVVLHTGVERMMPIQISSILQAFRNKVSSLVASLSFDLIDTSV